MFGADGELRRAADVAMSEIIGLKEGESVLIVTNPVEDVRAISEALFDAALDLGGAPALLFQGVKGQLDFAEPAVIGALRTEPDVIISISMEKLGKDREALKTPFMTGERTYDHVFTYLLGEKRSRSFWSPGVTVEMFVKTVPIDYGELRRRCSVLKGRLDRAVSAHVTSPGGTDLSVGLRGRAARSDDGDFTKPGRGGNLPAGETFISPELGASEGVIAFDGCMSLPEGEVIPEQPIVVHVKDGFAYDIAGGEEATLLNEALKRSSKLPFTFAEEGKISVSDAGSYSKNTYSIGEFGIGLNPNAEIVGNMLEDEKVFRTCHFALGSNYDEDAKALTHLDGLVKEPTVVLVYEDGERETVIENGDLLV